MPSLSPERHVDPLLLIMRVLHIVLGVFWAGTLIFTAFFLLPAIREAGPDGAKVIAGLMRRRFLTIMPIVALVTILTGFWLYWKVSLGFQPTYMGSGWGMAIGTAGVTAVVAFGLGLAIVRPSMLRAMALSQAAAAAPPAERDAKLAQAQGLRVRAGKAGVAVAILLVITTALMAVARFL